MIEFEQEKQGAIASIKVVGIGGAGGNTVNSIIQNGSQGFECIVVNTDAQALDLSKAESKVQIGIKSTKGLGTGANPEIGQRSAEEDLDKVLEVISDADIVFLAAGMGGGTGSGALPVIARALREKGILSIAIVTKPFLFEGKRRERVAAHAIQQLEKDVDTLIIIPNQKLLEVVDQNVSMIDAFDMINEVLSQSVRGISDIITKPGHINVDFADVRTIMKDRGIAVMGTGKASGSDRAIVAAENAISSPLLENVSIKGSHGVLLNITGGKNLGLHEISQAASIIYDQAHKDANIILGSVIDESLDEEIVVTIIATGFDAQPQVEERQEVQVRATILDRSEESLLEPSPENSAEQELSQEEENTEAVSSIEKKEERLQQMAEPSQSSYESSYEKNKNEASIDMNDLDVPAFMRKEAGQEGDSSK